MQQPLAPPPPPFLPSPKPELDLTPLLNLVAAVGGVLAVLVGLVGAITVNLIFADTILPQLVAQNSTSSSDSTTIAVVADIVGFIVFGLAASATVSRARRRHQ